MQSADEEGASARPGDWRPDLQEIAREHAAIHEVVRRIEAELDRLLENPAAAGEHWELPELARSCRERLRRHFRLEEDAGLFGDAALPDDPDTRSAAQELVRQHREFEQRIGRIVDELETGFVPGDTVQGCFDGELRSLISDMARHEALESELMRRLPRGGPDRREG